MGWCGKGRTKFRAWPRLCCCRPEDGGKAAFTTDTDRINKLQDLRGAVSAATDILAMIESQGFSAVDPMAPGRFFVDFASSWLEHSSAALLGSATKFLQNLAQEVAQLCGGAKLTQVLTLADSELNQESQTKLHSCVHDDEGKRLYYLHKVIKTFGETQHEYNKILPNVKMEERTRYEVVLKRLSEVGSTCVPNVAASPCCSSGGQCVAHRSLDYWRCDGWSMGLCCICW